MEKAESFAGRAAEIEDELRRLPRRPPDDEPLFTELLGATNSSVVTVTFDDGLCLQVFSTPLRAADYVRTVLPGGPPVRYLSSSPLQLIRMLRDVEKSKIEYLILDRCPRCFIAVRLAGREMTTANDLINLWSIQKATELARADLYFSYASESAQAGRLEIARDVALEMVGHVSLEDPRPHVLLGQLGVRLKDRRLLREAKVFLRFLKVDRWEQKLHQAARSGSTEFQDHPS